MDFLIIFTIFSCFYIVKASESSEEVNELLSTATGRKFMKGQMREMFETEPLEMISSWIQMMTTDNHNRNNATVVATQNVYNEDGSVKEVKTLELFIPNLEKKSAITELKESANQQEDDDDDDFNVSEMVETFRQLSNLGFDAEISAAELEPVTRRGSIKKGQPEITSAFYINPDIVFALHEGVLYFNKTITVETVQEVEDKIKALQNDKNINLPISVLKYNGFREFLSEKSDIKPELLAYIKNIEGDVPKPMQDEILHSLVKSSLENPNNITQICRDVVTDLESKFPTGKFLVVSEDVDGMYITKDISMEVAFAFTDLDKDDTVYKIYGVLVV